MARTSKAKITDSEIVQRKLSDVATTVTVEVPWSNYETYTAYIQNNLSEEGVEIDADEIQLNEAVFNMFEKRVIAAFESYIDSGLDDEVLDCCYDDTHKIYAKQIKEAAAKLAAERKERDNAKEVLIKELIEEGLILAVSQKNRNKAVKILEAAGLL